ncbi:hypothetical protein SAICODRAFT_192008 [Saitoella complicata NRRL Y-17804]|uniref:Uncharacterized protein n=1 Tax=Saitoella complicata (strain BCRC 22490 / CBS 7301 / JCM 7358 / NBRC 10748 / NRRL Y-17804) TaxID=698492 RepID=A0A0E9NQC6_SAICN|nr:uncharacterized protein SAICODRAFT_192008 [Saitoella complicata NRRL Y-17804]ODQ49688.1 hypothetical protein SAICODRAFT_192008 [Saitoella complicata NRRL Y-17804]GAO51871.1 hypothetical protein G7K_5962-t1 [Saitoella complicata NRRL Y-17804]
MSLNSPTFDINTWTWSPSSYPSRRPPSNLNRTSSNRKPGTPAPINIPLFRVENDDFLGLKPLPRAPVKGGEAKEEIRMLAEDFQANMLAFEGCTGSDDNSFPVTPGLTDSPTDDLEFEHEEWESHTGLSLENGIEEVEESDERDDSLDVNFVHYGHQCPSLDGDYFERFGTLPPALSSTDDLHVPSTSTPSSLSKAQVDVESMCANASVSADDQRKQKRRSVHEDLEWAPQRGNELAFLRQSRRLSNCYPAFDAAGAVSAPATHLTLPRKSVFVQSEVNVGAVQGEGMEMPRDMANVVKNLHSSLRKGFVDEYQRSPREAAEDFNGRGKRRSLQ